MGFGYLNLNRNFSSNNTTPPNKKFSVLNFVLIYCILTSIYFRLGKLIGFYSLIFISIFFLFIVLFFISIRIFLFLIIIYLVIIYFIIILLFLNLFFNNQLEKRKIIKIKKSKRQLYLYIKVRFLNFFR